MKCGYGYGYGNGYGNGYGIHIYGYGYDSNLVSFNKEGLVTSLAK